ncbi:MAG: cadmium-translocating P-type ATPase [Alphaproteobacteria bacterium]|nr:cadmium-translocating P-type ATPase [Alphaproteobacteria bacterium]
MSSASLYAPFVTAGEGGKNRLVLSIEGVHCPACIQKIESAIVTEPDVTEARLNYTTKRLNIIWNGAADRADGFIARINGLGYKARPFEAAKAEATDSEYAKFLRLCLGVSGFASGNIMLLSFALWMTTTQQMGIMTRELFHLISALIAVPTVFFSGRPFFRSAYAVLSKGRTNMDVPISLGILLATGMSLFEMFRGAEHVFFDSAVMLIFFLLIGRYLDFLALANARRAAGDLVSMMSGTATVLEGDIQRPVLIRDLREGMVVLVGVGERIPADATVIDGASDIDTSPVTGESLPVHVKVGEALYSGTINMAAPLKIRILRAAENSLLADVIRMMEKAEQGQAKYVRIADRAARMYTPVVHVLAASTFVYWLLLAHLPWEQALMIAVTVLIITCPCALGLAVPVVQMLAVGRLMKKGVMVKTGDALERLSGIDTVMLDKTGTLTVGEPRLLDNAAGTGLKLAASLAAHSKHPLSRAIVHAYEGQLFPLSVNEVQGHGLESVHEGKRVRLGSRAWCGDTSAPDSADTLELWLDVEGAAPIRFGFADPLRADTQSVIGSLKANGFRIVLASGDRESAVREVASKLGIAEWHAGMKPANKFALLDTLKGQGRKVLMVGDGLNDAPVLAGAYVSASPASGLDIARNAADLVYTGDKFAPVLLAHKVAKFSQRLVVQNFALAILYNVFAVPMAMAGYVTPLVAAIAMSSSSVIVIANAFRLRTIL